MLLVFRPHFDFGELVEVRVNGGLWRGEICMFHPGVERAVGVDVDGEIVWCADHELMHVAEDGDQA